MLNELVAHPQVAILYDADTLVVLDVVAPLTDRTVRVASGRPTARLAMCTADTVEATAAALGLSLPAELAY